MRYSCTCFDANYLTRGLALHQSLVQHAGAFELVILCLDETAETMLRQKALPHIRLLSLAELVAKYPALAAARSDRTKREFYSTCPSWLMQHLLPQVPAGEFLTYLAADLFFYASPQAIHDEIGTASIAIMPRRFPPALAHRERYGKFDASWISLRHDATGLACAADWAQRCAAWCFTLLEPDRYVAQKYLDAWPARFPGTVSLGHPGANLAPWNLAGRTITAGPAGPQIDGQPVISYHFHGLVPLGGQLYDPGLHRYDLAPDEALRELVYRPYLRQLGGQDPADAPEEPDIVPPALAGDPRCGPAIPPLLEQLRTAEREREAGLVALEQNRAAARRIIEEGRAATVGTAHYVQELEHQRSTQRQALLENSARFKSVYSDLTRNVAYLGTLEAEIAAHVKLGSERETHIARLTEQLARAGTSAPLNLSQFGAALEPVIRRLVVAKFHLRLLPQIIRFTALGTSVEIFASPPEYTQTPPGPVIFRPETLGDWLGRINSVFAEQAYLLANPDVADAVRQGRVASGWDHFQRFGRREGRNTGNPGYHAGLAEADAVAFDLADAPLLRPSLVGRLQPHHTLFISNCPGPDVPELPPDTEGTVIPGNVLFCARPPKSWLEPRLPAVTT